MATVEYEPTHAERQRDRERFWEIHDPETYLCPDCGRSKEEHGREWEVHHINGVAGNAVALCEPCHRIRHGAEAENIDIEAWKAAFVDGDADGAREDHSDRDNSHRRFHPDL